MSALQTDEFDDCLEMARALLGGYEGAGDLWEANEHVNRALRARPNEPEAWILKSQILSSLDDDPAALAAAEMAVKSAPPRRTTSAPRCWPISSVTTTRSRRWSVPSGT